MEMINVVSKIMYINKIVLAKKIDICSKILAILKAKA